MVDMVPWVEFSKGNVDGRPPSWITASATTCATTIHVVDLFFKLADLGGAGYAQFLWSCARHCCIVFSQWVVVGFLLLDVGLIGLHDSMFCVCFFFVFLSGKWTRALQEASMQWHMM